MNTKERILEAALVLFNDRGERNVTTNHIASHLGISPGNLYYHFRNKSEIVFEIYQEYERLVDQTLQVPKDHELTIEDKAHYLEAIFEGMWVFRFLHRDLAYFLESDERLRDRYAEFSRRCLENVGAIYQGLRKADLIAITDEEITALAINSWLVATSWATYLRTAVYDSNLEDQITRDRLRKGIYQVFALERPYLKEHIKDEVERVQLSFLEQ
ncbi:TetR/AcrR family transcriptional regulator [Litoribacillus peritrichatus]